MIRTLRFPIVAALFFLGIVFPSFSQRIDARLSEGFARVGQAVQLTITVSDGPGAQVPRQVDVDGLEIRFYQNSSRFETMNGRTSSSISYTYLVIPLQEGNFTIPPIDIRIGTKLYRTGALKLQVGSGGGGGSIPVLPALPVPQGQGNMPPPVSRSPVPAPPDDQQEPDANAKVAFGELLVPKKTAYVGEVVPVEMRFYFDANYSVRLNDRPSFTGDGFTVMRFSKPGERQQQIKGRLYNVVTYQTALVPVKTGKLEIPPATLESLIQVPGSLPPGFDDFFGGLLGNFAGQESREMKVETASVPLEVKPLPKDGMPENFTGAIGRFTLSATATPKKAEQGEPIALKVYVTGQGNFEAMGAPALTEDAGWRTYPPSEEFDASTSDAIGLNGQKKFEYTIVAREDRTATPGVEFSYFDPAQGKYVTLSTKPIAVVAQGGAPVDSTTTFTSSATPQPSPTVATASPTPTPAQHRESLLAENFTPAIFAPFVHDNSFLIANGVAAVLWLGGLLFCLIRSVSGSRAARQSAARRETRKFLKDLEDSRHGAGEFYQLAAQFARSRLVSEKSFIPPQETLEATSLTAETKAVIREVLEKDEELKYSTQASGAAIDADTRRRIVDNLKIFNDALRD